MSEEPKQQEFMMPTVTIQQREIPAEHFGQLSAYDGPAHSVADLRLWMDQHGYALLRGALDPGSVMAARQEVLSRLQTVGEIQEPSIEGRVTWQSERPNPKDDDGRFWTSVNQGTNLRKVTHGQTVHDLVAAVLGEPARAHDLMYLRPMAPGGVTPLHYDFPFFAGDSERIHTVWIPLGDVPLVHGPLAIIENSFQFDDLLRPIHAVDYKHDRRNDTIQQAAYEAQNEMHPIDLAKTRSVRILSTDFAAGDVIIFSGNVLHGSLDNNSPLEQVRLSCDVRYQPAADPHTDERYFGAHPQGAKGGGYADMRGAKPITRATGT